VYGNLKKPNARKIQVFPAAEIPTRGCRTRSFSDDYADAEVFSLRSFLCLPSPLQNLVPRHAQPPRDVFVARGVSRRRLLRETLPRSNSLLLQSKALAALALTAHHWAA
jgi:hypothetical protein